MLACKGARDGSCQCQRQPLRERDHAHREADGDKATRPHSSTYTRMPEEPPRSSQRLIDTPKKFHFELSRRKNFSREESYTYKWQRITSRDFLSHQKHLKRERTIFQARRRVILTDGLEIDPKPSRFAACPQSPVRSVPFLYRTSARLICSAECARVTKPYSVHALCARNVFSLNESGGRATEGTQHAHTHNVRLLPPNCGSAFALIAPHRARCFPVPRERSGQTAY
jgi:hypothetical protein